MIRSSSRSVKELSIPLELACTDLLASWVWFPASLGPPLRFPCRLYSLHISISQPFLHTFILHHHYPLPFLYHSTRSAYFSQPKYLIQLSRLLTSITNAGTRPEHHFWQDRSYGNLSSVAKLEVLVPTTFSECMPHYSLCLGSSSWSLVRHSPATAERNNRWH